MFKPILSRNRKHFLMDTVGASNSWGSTVEIAYDNLKTAVKKILQGSEREEQEQFIALRTHYLYRLTFAAQERQ
jgi:hypothetical protein